MDKGALRKQVRALRRTHVVSLAGSTRALVFSRPPAAIAELVPEGACVGLYSAVGHEAPTQGYARWFHENGRTLALPRFAAHDALMAFHAWDNPWDDDALESGPYAVPQPKADAAEVHPQFVIVPLVGFTASCDRLGQGGGHYDRWLAANPDAVAVGLAWDAQLCDSLPVEPHDRPLRAVVTPTRIYQGID